MPTRGHWRRLAQTLARAALSAVAIASLPATAFAAPPTSLVQACTSLTGTTLPPQAIALPTDGAQIESATIVAAIAPGNQAGDFCRITGIIKSAKPSAPDIRFDLNLPGRWNGRALQEGGGGYNGVVVSGMGVAPFSPYRAPLAQGYATFGDDSGHVGNSGLAIFGLNDEAVVNFGYEHLKKTHDVAVALITRAYGRAPDHMYFAGGSTGGREGYTVIQRYPDDYDGVIADSPALNFTGVRLLGVKLGQAEYVTPGGYIPPALLERVYQRSLDVCDRLDGAADGIVSDVDACRKHEADVVDALRCPANSQDAPSAQQGTCLTDAQVATLNLLRDGISLPYHLGWDVNVYRGYNIFEGTHFTGGLGLGREPAHVVSPSFITNGYLYTQGDGYIRYFIARDASFDSLKFDVQHPGKYQRQLVAMSQTIGAMNPDLGRYIARGGKLITLQGLADEVISPNQTIAYYNTLISRYGAQRVDSFMRLYMVPGFQHGGGAFIPAVDLLGALDNWVSKGVSPETLTATDIAPATNGRSRPLCRYPSFPRYIGKGNLNDASSFLCAHPGT
jgi:hypothetical protein